MERTFQSDCIRELVDFSKRLPQRDRFLSDIVPNIRFKQAVEYVESSKARLERSCKKTLFCVVWHPEEETPIPSTTDYSDYITCTSSGNVSTDPAAEFAAREQETKGHLHVYHNCRFTASWCRCPVVGERGRLFKRRGLPRRLLYCEDLEKKYWFNWLFYFCRTPRRILYVAFHEIPGQLGQLLRLEDLQELERIKKDRTFEPMEIGDLPCENSDRESIKPGTSKEDQTSSKGSSTSSSGISAAVPGSDYRPSTTVSKKILEFDRLLNAIKSFTIVPISSTCDDEEWINNPKLRYFSRVDPDYKRGCDLIARWIEAYTVADVIAHVACAPNPKWFARTKEYYYSETASLKIVVALLEHQYGNNEAIVLFLERLSQIMTKTLPKKNALYICGPPNSGKTYFVEMLAAFWLNPGYVANFVRGENFPLQDCVNKRILIWNEPSIAPSLFEDVKMLTGGDPLPAKVKYQGNVIIKRTPVLFTANNNPFNVQDPVWSSRIFFEKWTTAPFLKQYTMYLHPMTTMALFNKYEVLF